MADLSVKLGNLKLKNPVMAASGTFGFGTDYLDYLPPEKLGAVMVKGVAVFPSHGNPTPRVAEVESGMLNAIGLQGPGIRDFLEKPEYLPALSSRGARVIVNIWGKTIEHYREAARMLEEAGENIHALEINVSCPNIKEGGIAFGTDIGLLSRVVSEVREVSSLPLITKLSPNVPAIADFAKAAVDSGSDMLSLINTLPGMSIDAETWQPRLANVTGGLSGPAIKPVALKLVYDAANAVDVPIIGMGGISCTEDAVEFFLAGASAVAVGTAIFAEPSVPLRIIEGLNEYLDSRGLGSVTDIVGKLRTH